MRQTGGAVRAVGLHGHHGQRELRQTASSCLQTQVQACTASAHARRQRCAASRRGVTCAPNSFHWRSSDATFQLALCCPVREVVRVRANLVARGRAITPTAYPTQDSAHDCQGTVAAALGSAPRRSNEREQSLCVHTHAVAPSTLQGPSWHGTTLTLQTFRALHPGREVRAPCWRVRIELLDARGSAQGRGSAPVRQAEASCMSMRQLQRSTRPLVPRCGDRASWASQRALAAGRPKHQQPKQTFRIEQMGKVHRRSACTDAKQWAGTRFSVQTEGE